MDELALLMRFVVAAVFFAAALGKLLSVESTDGLLDAYELDSRLAPAVRVLPLVDASLGVGLLISATSRVASVVTCASLVLFSVFIVRTLRRGHTGNCNCFGRLHSSEIGWRPLVRNGVLAGASAWIAFYPHQPGVSLGAHDLRLIWSHPEIDAAAILAVAAAGAFFMMSKNRRSPAIAEVAGITSGAAVSRWESDGQLSSGYLTTLAGDTLSLPGTGSADTQTIFVFVDPACRPCQTVVPTLRRWWDAVTLNRLVIVTDGPASLAREFLVGIPPERIVIDEDSVLATRYGVVGTPSAVCISPGDEFAHTIVTGPMAIDILLRQSADPAPTHRHLLSWQGRIGRGDRRRSEEALSSASDALAGAWSRREVLTAAGVGTTLALATAVFGNGQLSLSTGAVTTCPSCGECVDCDWNTTAPDTLSCHPCKKKCSNAQLCTGYAIKFADYAKLQSYLHDHGFTQSGAPTAAGLTKNGTQAYLALLTEFTGGSTQNPKATLMYRLTNTTEGAAVLLLDGEGKIASVVTVNSAGQLVAGAVPPPPSSAKTTATTSSDSSSTASLTAASCADVCGQAWKLVLLSFEVALAAEPLGLAVLLAAYLLPNLGESGASAADALSALNAMQSAASLSNLAFGLVKDKATDQVQDFDQGVVCNAICNTKLKACCNYSGACFDSDAVCEKNCPGGLKHPLAHCDVYVNGKKVSTLVPGA